MSLFYDYTVIHMATLLGLLAPIVFQEVGQPGWILKPSGAAWKLKLKELPWTFSKPRDLLNW